MREIAIAGAVRSKKVITTLPDPAVARASDHLDRDFVTPAPRTPPGQQTPLMPPLG
ncbi:hypothetical protein [Streptomyces qinglanensis]|uniref:hypothetical protein n=1 Tax=Streptomyces qinglanensis TaxID=943816 RepID=UPI0013A6C336|nr:hypothetical protein [Streptomyces qinglanensis]